MYSFETLKAWQEARKLVVSVYRLLDSFPKFEKYALCDQIRRAIVSVPSNLAEGSGRSSLKEQIHFIEISYGSLMEAYNQLIIAADLKYIDEQSLESLTFLKFIPSRVFHIEEKDSFILPRYELIFCPLVLS